MTKVESPPPGSVLVGRYRVERELGSGGMGVVVEATHLALGSRVAVKLMNPELAAVQENVARFLREARVAATLPTEHIARVSDYGQAENGAPYLVMELLSGHDLAEEIQRCGRLAVPDAVDVILEACVGIAHAHAAGLVHRDIKPANLYRARRPGRPPIVKVLDFGLTKEAQSREQVALTQTGTVFGTPQYMSPEQVLSSKNVDHRSDQHALAMILFEALTGRPPYQGESASQLFVIIATADPPKARSLRPEVPADLDAAIVRALAKKPGDRFPNLAGFAVAIAPFGGPCARELAASVARILAASPMTAGDVDQTQVFAQSPRSSSDDLTSSMDPVKRGRRARTLAIGGALVGAFVLGFGGWLALYRTRSSASVAMGPPVASNPAPSAVTTPAVTPADTTTAAPVDTGSAAATGAPAPSTSASSAGRQPAAGKPAPHSSAVRKAIGVFGERR